MQKFPIGIIIDSFRTDIPTAVKKAAECGAQGIQVYSTRGEMAPENLTSEKRKEFLKLVKDNGLTVSALCGDLGGGGFIHKDLNKERVEKSKRIIDLAKDLETDVVTTHIGVVPSDPNHDRYKIMQEACFELAEYADSINAHFAVETGPETSAVLKGFLDSLNSTGVGVNLDPANLVMVTGDAKDGKQLFFRDPEIVYGIKKDVIVTDDSFIEVPLGEGSVDFPKYLAALEEIGYKGFLTVEREVGDNPEKDIKSAVNFLKEIMSE